MPKTNVERITFVKGLITESSPLTFPENASIEEDNFILNREGSRDRRLGMDYEDNNVMLDSGLDLSSFVNTAVVGFRWENANNDPTNTIGVVQVGYTIWFVDGFATTLSATVLGSISISSIAAQNITQFAAISGKLIAVNAAFTSPKLIAYDGTTFTESDVSVEVRDIWGVDDGLDLGERLGTLSVLHEYNLFNQGWPAEVVRTTGTDRVPHDKTFRNIAVYPSNSDIWYLAKNIDDAFDPLRLKSVDIGTRQAAQGRVIIDAFSRGTSRQSFMTDNLAGMTNTAASISTIPGDSEQSTVTTVAAFAGRIFYAGVDSEVSDPDNNTPLYSSTIFFTQVIAKDKDFGRCHSVNDTSSEAFNILLATDGGTITIAEASRILRLMNVGDSLVVIAENGVWEITGPDGVFRADDFSIRQVSNVGATNASSAIQAEESIYFWSKAGIYALAPRDVTGKLATQNITEITIQSFYTGIESVGRTNAVGRYDSDARRVSWLYNDTDDYDGVTQKNKYNRELVLDTVLGAFYTITFGELATDSPYVAAYLPTGGFDTSLSIQNVEVNGVQVQVNGEDVVVTTKVRSRGRSSTRYIAIKPNATGNVQFTFGVFKDPDFLDWKSDDTVGLDAPAHMIAGYEIFADTMRRKQVPFLVMHFRMTEDAFVEVNGDLEATNRSSCLVQARWDFANSAASGKFGTQFQAYRLPRNFTPAVAGDFDYGKEVITTKTRIRGFGRSFSMRIDSEPGRNLYIYGWGLVVEGGSSV